MKHFYIVADVGEGVPSYDFVLKAETLEQAEKEARKILKNDYPDVWSWNNDGIDFSCEEITAEQLLERMTLNQ